MRRKFSGNVKIKPFDIAHLEIKDFRIDPVVGKAIEKNFKCISFAETAFYKEDNTPLGFGVFFNKWQRHYEIVLIVNVKLQSLAFRYRAAGILATKQIVERFAKQNKPLRLQANCSVNDSVAFRFAEGIGFRKEGLMKKFGYYNEDNYRLAMVWE